MKARQFDVKEAATEPDPGSNPTDDNDVAVLQDNDVAVLQDHADDPVQEELISLISEFSEDEQIDLVTLAWLGRDDYVAGDWTSLLGQGADARNELTAGYLIGEPLLADHLTAGLDAIGLSCADYEGEHL